MTSNNKMHYNNDDVIIVASEPSAERRTHSKAKMKNMKVSSNRVLKTLNEIDKTFENNRVNISDHKPSKSSL
ncbi:hypothetical protein [Halobacillus sp. B23F22_1]|uniref:hypothetical protein n=1 Tax=Halobacillus sp. B23F22_1 TaxID=3459514 RepID=UPI00373F79BD